jgi:hypothetical protein
MIILVRFLWLCPVYIPYVLPCKTPSMDDVRSLTRLMSLSQVIDRRLRLELGISGFFVLDLYWWTNRLLLLETTSCTPTALYHLQCFVLCALFFFICVDGSAGISTPCNGWICELAISSPKFDIVSPKKSVGAPENVNHSTWDWRLRRKRFIYYLAFIKLKSIGFSQKKQATSPHSVLKCEYQYGSTTGPICHPVNQNLD